MNSVFAKFGVCLDIAEKITKEVHKGFQKEINDHISVIIGWNENYDYWKFHKQRVSTKLVIASNNRRDANFIEFFNLLKSKKKMTNTQMSSETYINYIFSEKNIFKFLRPVRFGNFCSQIEIVKEDMLNLYKCTSRGQLPLIHPFIKYHDLLEDFNTYFTLRLHISNYGIDATKSFETPLEKFYALKSSNLILKKELVQYLNNNGISGKFTNKSKKILWRMIINID